MLQDYRYLYDGIGPLPAEVENFIKRHVVPWWNRLQWRPQPSRRGRAHGRDRNPTDVKEAILKLFDQGNRNPSQEAVAAALQRSPDTVSRICNLDKQMTFDEFKDDVLRRNGFR